MLVCRVRDLPLGHSGQQGLLQRCSLVLTLAQPDKSDDGRVKRCSLNAMYPIAPADYSDSVGLHRFEGLVLMQGLIFHCG